MRKITKYLTQIGLVVAGLFVAAGAKAQVLNDIQTSLGKYQQYALPEKIFVHTDKIAYLTGEIMWFKLYDVDGITNQPLSFSKVAYVEVLDNTQTPVLQAKIALNNGSGTGSLYIPVSASTANYKLRAYTNWMKNFSPDYYFEKNITIINPVHPPEAAAKQAKASNDIQFFPEGGNLVSGISSKVAFRAIGADAKGIDFKGAIVDQHNDTVVRFKPSRFGIGNFSFTPDANNAYKAVINYGTGKPLTKDLPAINKQGYVMQLTDNGSGTLDINVTTNAQNSGDLYIFAHTRQVVKAAKTAAVSNGQVHFTIDKNSLGEGVSHITIFNDARQPVCERLYFKRPKQQLMLQVKADKQQYNIRKKVDVSISATNGTNVPVAADLSMSVFRLDSLQKMDEGDIYSYVWLSSDLKGYIESPGYYFKNANAETDAALDNLMLSQGWRRFDWADVLKNKTAAFNFLPELNGHIITGKITEIGSGKPANNIITFLGVPGKRVQLTDAVSDSTGRLLFNTMNFYGAGEVVAEPDIRRDSTYRIDIQTPFSERFTQTPVPPLNLTADMQAPLETMSLGMQVQNVYAANKTRQFYYPLSDSLAFYGKPFKTYKLDDYTRFTTMEEVLREYTREVLVTKSHGHFHFGVVDDKTVHDSDPLIILDGIPVFDIDKLMAMDPLKIRRTDVVREQYFYHSASMEGIVNFTTYKGDLGGYEIDPKAVVVDYEGMQEERKFYSPVYESDQQAASRVPDFRNLLYWSPSVTVDNHGKSQASFYTSDETGKYIGVIQGITGNGEAGSQTFTFEVLPGYVANAGK